MYLQNEIEEWAEAKGIYENASFIAQVKGIAEETVEVAEAYTLYTEADGTKSALTKELGDIYVFWINACEIAGVNPDEAALAAYTKISGRTGVTIEGRFVKDSY